VDWPGGRYLARNKRNFPKIRIFRQNNPMPPTLEVPFTEENYLTLVAAIAQGSRVVEYGDKRVEYRSLDEMMRILGMMERTLGINNTGAGRRVADYYTGKE